MSRRFKIDVLLPPADRAELRRMARDPAHTTDTLHQWVRERGCDVSRGAVHNWRRRQLQWGRHAEPASRMRAFLHHQAEMMPPDRLEEVYNLLAGEPLPA